MSTPKFTMVTVAACSPGYLAEALNHLGTLCDELKADAGAISTRFGVIATGDNAGDLILFQTYADMAGIEAAFGVYQGSSTYRSLVSSDHLSVKLRNILKIEDIALPNQTMDQPGYGVLTRWGSADLMLDRIAAELPHFEAGGAMLVRYTTILTGPAAGRRLLIAGYPSMDAIEKTYNGLRASAGYQSILGDIDLDFRNIVRVAG